MPNIKQDDSQVPLCIVLGTIRSDRQPALLEATFEIRLLAIVSLSHSRRITPEELGVW